MVVIFGSKFSKYIYNARLCGATGITLVWSLVRACVCVCVLSSSHPRAVRARGECIFGKHPSNAIIHAVSQASFGAREFTVRRAINTAKRAYESTNPQHTHTCDGGEEQKWTENNTTTYEMTTQLLQQCLALDCCEFQAIVQLGRTKIVGWIHGCSPELHILRNWLDSFGSE